MDETTGAADDELNAITVCQMSIRQLTFAQKCNQPTCIQECQHCPTELTLHAAAQFDIKIRAWIYKVPFDFKTLVNFSLNG
jgi:hypothetical protein